MLHPDYTFWTGLGVILVLMPASWHWRAGNVATLSLIAWLALANLCLFIDAIVWANDFSPRGGAYCNISARIILALTFAVPSCSLAQMRRLESVASTRRTHITAASRVRRKVEEVFLCIGLPILMLPIHYLVEGHRFDIVETMGCSMPWYHSWPGYFVRSFIPIILSLTSLIFAVLAIRWFLVRRLQFRAVLSAAPSLTIDRYIRLVALAISDVAILLTFEIIFLATNLPGDDIQGDSSFNTVHFNYNQISQYPAGILNSAGNTSLVTGVYAAPVYSIVFFIFFGFGEEAITEYLAMGQTFVNVLRHCGFIRPGAVAPPDIIPALGSKVISATASPWLSHHDDVPTALENRGEEIFKPAVVHGGPVSSAAIPVLIERSVV